MADQQDMTARAVPAFDFAVDLGDQRTDRIDYPQPSALRGKFNRAGAAMGGKNRYGAFRHFIDFLNEDCAQTFQPGHYRLVVDNRPAYEYRCTVQFQGLLNRVDRPLDPGAEPARIGQQNASLAGLDRDRVRGDRRSSHSSPQLLHSLAAKERTTEVHWDRLFSQRDKVTGSI